MAGVTPDEPWRPANPTDAALLAAVSAGDARAYCTAIVEAELYLAGLPPDPLRPGRRRLLTTQLLGRAHLLVFTSVEALAAYVRASAGEPEGISVLRTRYADLLDGWPHPAPRLAINPATPVDAYLAMEAVTAAAEGERRVPTAAQVIGWDTDLRLHRAVLQRDVDAYLTALLDAELILPVGEPVDGPQRLAEPDFPWCPVQTAHGWQLDVFTSPVMMAASYPDPPATVRVPCLLLAAAWPDGGYAMAVNPGTSLDLRLPAEHVPLLWLAAAAEPDPLPGAAAAQPAAGQPPNIRGSDSVPGSAGPACAAGEAV